VPASWSRCKRTPDPPAATLVILGSRDTEQGVRPEVMFRQSRRPRILVRLGGANHLGYTDPCSADNRVCADRDAAGGIARGIQQDAAAAFLIAAARLFLLEDEDMPPYLQGIRDIGLRAQLPSLQVHAEL